MFNDKITLAIAEAAKKCMDEDLKGKQHKIDANKNGKIDAEDFKKLRKEDTINEEDGKYGYVAFGHDGKRHELYANTSYEAKQKAVGHFKTPKSKQHLVSVTLAKKDGKDVVHTATESVQLEGAVPSTEKTVKLKHKTSGKEIVVTANSADKYKAMGYHSVNEGALDDLRDRQAAARENDSFKTPAKQADAKRKVQGSQYGGSKQKDDKEIDEETITEVSKGTLSRYINRAKDEEGTKDRSKGIRLALRKKYGDVGYGFPSPKVRATEEFEALEESKAHIEQHLADRDINSKVEGKTVQVHTSDVAKAKRHVKMAGYDDHKVVGGLNEDKMSDEDMNQREKIVKGMKKNIQGFKARYGDRAKEVMYATATKNAMKEEVEQLDELSKDTLGSYVKKAEADKKDSIDRYNAQDRDAQGKKISDKDRSPARRAIDDMLFKRSDKRIAGLKTANAKLSQEEVDNETFTKEVEDQKKSAAGTKKQPDVAKAAVQGVKMESFLTRLSTKGENND